MPSAFSHFHRVPGLGALYWLRKSRHFNPRAGCRSVLLALLALMPEFVSAQNSAPGGLEEHLTREQPGQMYEKRGEVRFKPAVGTETNAMVPQPVGFDEELRTRNLSGARLRLADQSTFALGELTRLQIVRPTLKTNAPVLRIHQGQIYGSSRGRLPIPIQALDALGVTHGTEFLVAVDTNTGQATFTMFDGQIVLTNDANPEPVTVKSGEQAIVVTGQPIKKVAILEAKNIVQWWIYYPGVLDLKELELTPAARTRLSDSLTNYLAGSLVRALETFPGYPQPEKPSTDAERIYLAALFLGVGAVDKTEALLQQVATNAPAVRALQTLIKAVARDFNPAAVPKRSTASSMGVPDMATATEWLARSYQYQADHNLEAALKAARASVQRSPEFGFGWARVAELEFSFARTAAARSAVQRALDFAPRNAHAHTVKGFVLAAQNHIPQAIDEFEKTIELDPALGNAWLGRGLCRRRLGWFHRRDSQYATRNPRDWLSDLQAAASAEPHNALLRSYFGKGFTEVGDDTLAEKELGFANHLDSKDPTPLLYSALLKQRVNRINEAIRDLEASQERNDNRSLFRSQLMMDEDRAVRGANLASIYRDAGMTDVSLREAARAVADDYANFSTHLFLSESLDALRDPTRFNLRYETPWFNELLLANLLAPVGGTPLSQNVSQHEYSHLFDHDRIGLNSLTSYRSDGQIRELGSQFGAIGNTGWSLDLDYQHNDGVRPNNELDRTEWYTTIKQQITPQDSVMLLTKFEDYHSGDNFQYYDPNAVTTNLASYGIPTTSAIRTNLHFDEYQHPIVVAGYHHEWSPGVHSLLLGGRLENDQRFSDTDTLQLILTTNASGVATANSLPMDMSLRSQFEIYTFELNQIFQTERQHLVLGGRFQTGDFESTDRLALSSIVIASPFSFLTNYLNDPAASGGIREPFNRLSAYGYYTLDIFDDFRLTAGLAYDRLTFPTNFRRPPIAPGTDERDKLSPKAALVWTPAPEITFRGIFSRALGGVSFDESFRLEPTQLAGFDQAFRTIISESLVGSVSAPTFEVGGLALDVKLKTGTYLGIQAEILKSDVDSEIGAFKWDGSAPPPPSVLPALTPQKLEYEERTIAGTVNQLVSDTLSFGAGYRYTQSQLRSTYPEIPVSVLPSADSRQEADLHQTTIFALFNHPSGFFARAEANWYHQGNSGYSPALPPSDFWQGNIFLGWRLRHHRGELSVGVLNLNDTDYRLNPLTPYSELPRERVFMAQLKIRL